MMQVNEQSTQAHGEIDTGRQRERETDTGRTFQIVGLKLAYEEYR